MDDALFQLDDEMPTDRTPPPVPGLVWREPPGAMDPPTHPLPPETLAFLCAQLGNAPNAEPIRPPPATPPAPARRPVIPEQIEPPTTPWIRPNRPSPRPAAVPPPLPLGASGLPAPRLVAREVASPAYVHRDLSSGPPQAPTAVPPPLARVSQPRSVRPANAAPRPPMAGPQPDVRTQLRPSPLQAQVAHPVLAPPIGLAARPIVDRSVQRRISTEVPIRRPSGAEALLRYLPASGPGRAFLAVVVFCLFLMFVAGAFWFFVTIGRSMRTQSITTPTPVGLAPTLPPGSETIPGTEPEPVPVRTNENAPLLVAVPGEAQPTNQQTGSTVEPERSTAPHVDAERSERRRHRHRRRRHRDETERGLVRSRF